MLDFLNNYYKTVSQKQLDEVKSVLLPELQQIERGADVVQDLGAYLVYMGRVVTKAEFGKRVEMV